MCFNVGTSIQDYARQYEDRYWEVPSPSIQELDIVDKIKTKVSLFKRVCEVVVGIFLFFGMIVHCGSQEWEEAWKEAFNQAWTGHSYQIKIFEK